MRHVPDMYLPMHIVQLKDSFRYLPSSILFSNLQNLFFHVIFDPYSLLPIDVIFHRFVFV